MAYSLKYLNQGTRNQPLSAELERIYQQAAEAAGIDAIRVMSGGQPSSGPNRTGSHRHDDGGAGDIMFERGGRVLEFTNPEDLPYIQKWIANAKAQGLTGFGAGEGYMGNKTIHAGGGTEAIWGAGGSSKNTPEWLRNAVSLNSTPVPVSAVAQAPETAAPAVDPNSLQGKLSTFVGKDGTGSGMQGVQSILAGLKGSPPNPETSQITSSSISQEPTTQNPAAAQLMAGILADRRRRYV